VEDRQLGRNLDSSIELRTHPDVEGIGMEQEKVQSRIIIDDCRGYYSSSYGIKVLIEASMKSVEDRIPVIRLNSFLPKASKEVKKGKKNTRSKPE
jgi:hypothetical protein